MEWGRWAVAVGGLGRRGRRRVGMCGGSVTFQMNFFY